MIIVGDDICESVLCSSSRLTILGVGAIAHCAIIVLSLC
jgi:hypothetical protein